VSVVDGSVRIVALTDDTTTGSGGTHRRRVAATVRHVV